MIKEADILMGRDIQWPLSDDMKKNLTKLVQAINKFEIMYGHPLAVTSGYRPPQVNAATKGAAKKSHHMVCLAIDLHDPDGRLDAFCMANPDLLRDCGLYLEHPESTPNWCHLQCIAPASGNRIFRLK